MNLLLKRIGETGGRAKHYRAAVRLRRFERVPAHDIMRNGLSERGRGHVHGPDGAVRFHDRAGDLIAIDRDVAESVKRAEFTHLAHIDPPARLIQDHVQAADTPFVHQVMLMPRDHRIRPRAQRAFEPPHVFIKAGIVPHRLVKKDKRVPGLPVRVQIRFRERHHRVPDRAPAVEPFLFGVQHQKMTAFVIERVIRRPEILLP